MNDEIFMDQVDETRERHVKYRKGTTWIIDIHSDSDYSDEEDEIMSDDEN